jgi:trans-2,3-dihydro-3-hydroxyanthranilate isomerase
MMHYRFYTADVFTDTLFGGNQLAVFPDAQGIDPALMQQVAREFNLSETVFVLPPADPRHTRRLRIFTPATEMPFAGHPTVGAAYVLASIGAVDTPAERNPIVFEEGVGPVPVTIFATDGKPVMAQLTAAQPPDFGPPPPTSAVLAAMLGLDEHDLLREGYEPQAVSCGVPFLIVPLRNRSALARARLRRDHWEQALADYWAPSLYLISFDPELPDSHIRARMFAPGLGVDEDPATGAAATTLGGYLGQREVADDGTMHWRVEQGFEMGRPSLIEVEIDKTGGQIDAIRIGGKAVLVSEGQMALPITNAK